MRATLPDIDRSLIGAPRSSSRNPTLALFLGALLVFTTSMVAHLGGVLSLWIASVINTLCLYVLYTVNHEAVHRIAHHNRLANEWMGRVAAAMEGITFPLFRVIHLQHHAYTNDPVKDPDYVIGRQPRWLLPVWTLIRLTHDNLFVLRQGLWNGRRRLLIEHLLTVAVQVAVVILAAISGYLEKALLLWVVPVGVAGALIELTVAWLVHYPHESQHPLENTRMFRSRVAQILTLNQSYHLVHHLWARIPWFRYGAAYATAAEAVEDHSGRLAGAEVATAD